MPKSLVGKILKGIYDQTSIVNILTLDKDGKQLDKSQKFSCIDPEIYIKFLSYACVENKCNKQYDYNVLYMYLDNKIPCLASVNKNGDITMVTYDKNTLIFNGDKRDDIVINLRFFLKKCDKKYKLSGEYFSYDEQYLADGVKKEIYTTTIFKSGTLKFL
jgi:hypothetical protein